MVNNFDPNNMTSWGNRLFSGPNGIVATAQEASVYGGPPPPTVTPGGPTLTPTLPPTATSAPPTATIAPPTATSIPPTATAVPPTSTPGSGASCSVNYNDSNDWGSGFVANVTITNNGSSAISGWTLAFTFSGNQDITNLWNGVENQSGANVSVGDAGHNSTINANGGTASFGFQAAYSGSNAAPTTFTLNGVVCN
jgi:hypothetical protein